MSSWTAGWMGWTFWWLKSGPKAIRDLGTTGGWRYLKTHDCVPKRDITRDEIWHSWNGLLQNMANIQTICIQVLQCSHNCCNLVWCLYITKAIMKHNCTAFFFQIFTAFALLSWYFEKRMFQEGSGCCVPEFSMHGYPLSPKKPETTGQKNMVPIPIAVLKALRPHSIYSLWSTPPTKHPKQLLQ